MKKILSWFSRRRNLLLSVIAGQGVAILLQVLVADQTPGFWLTQLGIFLGVLVLIALTDSSIHLLTREDK
jgi:hypothetical protein